MESWAAGRYPVLLYVVQVDGRADQPNRRPLAKTRLKKSVADGCNRGVDRLAVRPTKHVSRIGTLPRFENNQQHDTKHDGSIQTTVDLEIGVEVVCRNIRSCGMDRNDQTATSE